MDPQIPVCTANSFTILYIHYLLVTFTSTCHTLANVSNPSLHCHISGFKKLPWLAEWLLQMQCMLSNVWNPFFALLYFWLKNKCHDFLNDLYTCSVLRWWTVRIVKCMKYWFDLPVSCSQTLISVRLDCLILVVLISSFGSCHQSDLPYWIDGKGW
jgi:hypothetical protein